MREAVNRCIRTSGEPNAVIDFARLVADPAAPNRLRPAYDSGDNFHPSDAGMAVAAADIQLVFPDVAV